MTRTRVASAERAADRWSVTLQDADGGARVVTARALVNAGGPWVGEVIAGVLHINSSEKVRLVRGSHIVTRRLFEHDRAYIFQGGDGRVVFAIPYETDFTLIGTTDRDHDGPPEAAACTPEEADYLRAAAGEYFRAPIAAEDVVWTYSGVRPLYDDGAKSATAATRDYVLSLDAAGAPLLNVFGGKITTYRRLAEAALTRLAPHLPDARDAWTARVPLPGGDFRHDEVARLVGALMTAYPFLDERWARRLVRAYGTEAREVLDGARTAVDLGRRFGHDLTEAEVVWLMDREWARTAEDVLWRRTKLGLRLDAEEAAELGAWMAARSAVPAEPRAAAAPRTAAKRSSA
jgi:glycerol-3-phosphate dehydrogenase